MNNNELNVLLARLENLLSQTRQYIGARYVPVYYKNSQDPTSSEWEPNVIYEPLTIVSLPNMHSYQSKKTVPANIGSPAQNPEYWYDQGYAQAYYQALQDQIDDMKDGDVPGSLQEQINDNASNITALSNNLDTIDNYVLMANVNKVIIIGDSYLARDSASIATTAMGLLNIAASDYLVQAEGSTGFAHANPNSKRFIDLLNETDNHFTNADVSHVIVIGGANDSLETSANILSYMSAFKTRCNTLYPNAKMIAGFVAATTDPTAIHAYADACRAYLQGCANENIPYLTNIEYVLHNYDYLDVDMVHPTHAGNVQLGKQIASALTYGKCEVHYSKRVHNSPAIFMEVNNGIASIFSGNRLQISLSNVTVNDATRMTETLSDKLITGSHFDDCVAGIPIKLFYNSGADAVVELGSVDVYQGNIHVFMNAQGSYPNCNAVHIPRFNIEFPTLMC